MGIEKPVFVSHENTLLYKNLIQIELVKLMYGDDSNEHFDTFIEKYSEKFRVEFAKKLAQDPTILQNYATDPEYKQNFLIEMRKFLETKSQKDEEDGEQLPKL